MQMTKKIPVFNHSNRTEDLLIMTCFVGILMFTGSFVIRIKA